MVSPDAPKQKVLTENPPEYSEEVVRIWELFEDLRGKQYERQQIRSREITDTVFDFGGLKGLVPELYEAVPLVTLMEELRAFDTDASEDAFKAIKKYSSKNSLNVDYVRAVSGDMLEINSFVDSYWAEKDTKKVEATQTTSLKRRYQNPWEVEHEQIPLSDVLRLISDEKDGVGVNIESLLISAASAYNTLRNSNDISEDHLLKTVYAVNSFYRPVLEIIGYDAFAMALEREAVLVHMSRNQGRYSEVVDGEVREVNYQRLEAAHDMIEAVGNPIDLLDKLMPQFLLGDSAFESVVHDSSDHSIQFGSGHIIGPDDNEVPLIWRLKSDTGIASKYDVENEKHAADVLGVTVVVPSYEYLADMFAIGVTSLENSRELLKPEPSLHKEHYLVVKGDDVTTEVADKLLEMGYDPDEVLHVQESTNGHQVAKITMIYRPKDTDVEIPVEIQFQTKEDRVISRAGAAAHALKHLGYDVSEEDLMVIKRIHERRMMTSEPGLTPKSMARQHELFSGRHVPKKIRQRIGSVASGGSVAARP